MMASRAITFIILLNLLLVDLTTAHISKSAFFFNREGSQQNGTESGMLTSCLLACLTEESCNTALYGSSENCSLLSQEEHHHKLQRYTEKWKRFPGTGKKSFL